MSTPKRNSGIDKKICVFFFFVFLLHLALPAFALEMKNLANWEAMKAVLENVNSVQSDLLVFEQVRRGVRSKETLNVLGEKKSNLKKKLYSPGGTGVLSNVLLAEVKEALKRYEKSKKKAIKAYREYNFSRSIFNRQSAKYVNYSNILEEVGDRVIDDLAGDPEKMVSWNSDLLDRWLAADGMMESYIGYLRSQYATSLYLIGESGREKAQAEVTSALRFQKEAIDSMAISGYFDRPAQEIDPDLAYLDIISEIFLTHKLAQKEMFEKFHKLSIASEEFNLAADDMIVTLQKASEEIEKNFRAR